MALFPRVGLQSLVIIFNCHAFASVHCSSQDKGSLQKSSLDAVVF